MTETATCERCGREIPKARLDGAFGGICPHCLGAFLAREEKSDEGRGRASALSRYEREHAPLKPGDLFRSFEIVDIVARGGMSYVFRARQRGLDRVVALKVLDPELAASDTFRARFHREAKILATLNHPNIVQVFEFGQEKDLLYLATEHVEGTDLETLFAREGKPERMRFLSIIRDIARGLRGIHEAGLIHRDIKPANILITASGGAKIADFGIAIDSKEDERLTETGTFIGTPHYVSPEHVQGKKVDGRSDLYSLGVILYQGLTGRTPFSAPNPTALLLKHVQEPPPAIWKAAEDVPPALGDMVRRLLAKNPSARPDSALFLERELDRVIGSSRPWKSIDENPESPPGAAPARHDLPSIREDRVPDRRLLLGAVAAAALLLAVALYVVFRSPEPAAKPAEVAAGREPRTPAAEPSSFPFPPEPAASPRPRPAAIPEPGAAAPGLASADPELLKLGSAERRRRLDQLTDVLNLSALALAYAETRQMPETAAHIRKLMARDKDKISGLHYLLERDGQDASVGVLILARDRVVSVQGASLEKLGPEGARKALRDVLVHVGPASRVRLEVDRDGETEALTLAFGERTKELAGVLQLVGLQPEEGTAAPVPAAAAPETPAAPASKPDSPAEPRAVAAPPPANPPSVTVRAAPPEGAALKEAERLIREVFKEDYAKKAAVDRGYFAKKLLKHALEAKESGADTFILLRESEDLACLVGDAETALKAVREEARRFTVNEMDSRMRVLSALARSARTLEENVQVARALAALADQAAAEENYDLCERASAAGGQTARKGKDIPLVAHFDAWMRECADLKARAESIRRAREALAANPQDVSANQSLGYQLCLLRGAWPEGLPHLSRGEPGRLREAAAADLERPAAAKDAAALGDLWWDLAEKEKGRPQECLRRRACYWYDRALGGLSGIVQVKVKQKLSGFGMSGNATGLVGWWRLDDGTGPVAADRVEGGHPGRMEGGTWGRESNEGSLGFDGDQTRVRLNLGELPAPWTVALWVKREAAPGLAGTLVDARAPQGTSLRLEQSPSTRRVGITQYNSIDQAFDYQVPEGVWTHLGFVATGKAVLLYANGALVGTWDRSVPLTLDMLGGQAGLSFRGSLSEVRAYGRALAPSEIGKLHELGRR